MCPLSRRPCNAVIAGNGDRSRLFECDVARFQNNCALGLDTNVLGHGAVFCAENFVAWFEVGYIFPNCFNDSGEVSAEANVLLVCAFHSSAASATLPLIVMSVDRID